MTDPLKQESERLLALADDPVVGGALPQRMAAHIRALLAENERLRTALHDSMKQRDAAEKKIAASHDPWKTFDRNSSLEAGPNQQEYREVGPTPLRGRVTRRSE